LQIEQYHLGEEARRAYQKENHFFILTVPSLSNGIESYTPREKGRGVRSISGRKYDKFL
jgi:hypothetical protein